MKLLQRRPAEYAIMTDTGLDVVTLHVGPETAAQFLGSQGLADGANIIALAFDSKQRSAPDRARLDRTAAPFELAARQGVLLKHGVYGLQVKFGRQIHDGAILVIERPDRGRLLVVAVRQMTAQVEPGFDMAIE